MNSRMLTALVAAFALTPGASAQPPEVPKHDARILRESLRDVINVGADLFNVNGDHAGCYRVYQGGLLAVRPVLPPEVQAKVEAALKAAERAPRYSDKAFELRAAIDLVRDWADPEAAKKAAAKTGDDGKTAAKKTTGDKPGKKTAGKKAVKVNPNLGQLSGKVTFEGRPAPPGFVTLVGGGRRFSSSIAPDGTFQFKTGLPPGKYQIAIERTPGAEIPKKLDIPERYRSEGTSGITIDVQRGKQQYDLNLVR